MPYTIIDTPVNVTRYLPKLAGIHTIIRYITRTAPHGPKCIQPAEVKAIQKAGKALALVCESYGDFKHVGHGGVSANDGAADGRYARALLPKLGAPAGAAVYFAVDTDATEAQLKNNVVPYFKAVAAAFSDGEYRVGVYGPGRVCQTIKDAGFAELFWLSNAAGWTGFKSFKPHADIVQALPTHMAGGLDVDPNTAQVDDFGQFVPYSQDRSLVTAAVTEEPEEGSSEDSEPPRLAQGDGVADAHEAVNSIADSGGFETVKSMFRSKIAWLTGTLGGGSAISTMSSDPETVGLFGQLLHKPSFWIVVATLAIAGAVVYYRWRDHGRGSVQ